MIHTSTTLLKMKNVRKDLRGYMFADIECKQVYLGFIKLKRELQVFKSNENNGDWRLMGTGIEDNSYRMRDLYEAYKALNSEPIPE